jgi:hypothetical protein
MYICKICGLQFVSEYGKGGYIDHVSNFVGNREKIIRRGTDDCVKMILSDGNKPRSSEDINSRLKCFCKWDNVDNDLKDNVIKIVKENLPIIEQAENKAKNITENLSDIEKYFLQCALI